MRKKEILWISIFGFFLVIISIFSKVIDFHDCREYISIAKYFAGIRNINLFSGHSLLYPIIISFFLKIWPSMIILKIVNSIWLLFIALVLLLGLKNKKAFLLFIFSPLTWYVSIQTTPILPASFFFFLSFIFFYLQKVKFHRIISGIFLGLSCAFYTPMILIGGIFVMVFFWRKQIYELMHYFIAILIGFSPRMILDYYLFKMPFYSIIRYFGANFIIAIGLNPGTRNIHILNHLSGLIVLIAISPFLFKLYKLNWKKYNKILVFLILSGLILLLRAAMLKYFLLISPIVLLLVASVLTEKELKRNIVLSIIITLLLISNFFIENKDIATQKDLEKIKQDFDPEYILGGPYESLYFSMFSWENKPYFIWWQDYRASIENRTNIREYEFKFDSKIPLKSRLKISGEFERFYPNKTYENFILVTGKEYFKGLEEFKLKKCYEVLCVYEK